jgi:type II secretory pathway pseudopilin PulG
MISKLALNKRRNERGWTLLELLAVLFVVMILAAIVMLLMRGFFSGARETALDTNIKSMKNAVDAFMTEAFKAPTEDGMLPTGDELKPIDFNASFIANGSVKSFYPHFLAELPRHWDEGVWKLDFAARVVFDMPPEEY